MQKIVLFIEPNDDAFITPSKIGHLFMNRFAIDEDPGFEIVKILELEKTSWAMSYSKHPEYKNFENERKQKGIDLITDEKLFLLSKLSTVHRIQYIPYRVYSIPYILYVFVCDLKGLHFR